jgi:hypothetical protein
MSLPKISHAVKTVTVNSLQQIIYMTFKLITNHIYDFQVNKEKIYGTKTWI